MAMLEKHLPNLTVSLIKTLVQQLEKTPFFKIVNSFLLQFQRGVLLRAGRYKKVVVGTNKTKIGGKGNGYRNSITSSEAGP